MRRIRKLVAVAAIVGVVSGTGVLVDMSPAGAQKVANPGSGFTLKVQEGLLRIKEESFDFNDETRQPQCSDGQNNDEGQDTAVDFPADSQCTSAADDSEVAGGLQPKAPIQLTGGTINANGTFTFANVSFPRQYLWVDDAPVVGSFQVNIDIVQLAAPTGTINANTGAMDLTMSVEVRASGGPLSSGCKISPININTATTGTTSPPGPNTPITGIPYNPATGRVTLVQNSYSVPGADGCSAFFVSVNGQINDQLGLPSAAGNNEARFLGEFVQPGADPQPAIVANLGVTPGVACRTTTFSAAGSTSVLTPTYSFDDTNDNSFEQIGSSNTRSVVIATPGPRTVRLRVSDPQGDFVERTAAYTVGANLPPTAPSQNLPRSPIGAAVPFTLGGSDPEGDAVSRVVITPPTNGTVTGTPPNLTYTPNPGFGGVDSLTYRVSDACASSADATGTVTFNVNRRPVADNQTVPATQDVAVNLGLTGSDDDGDSLTYSVATNPANGSLTGTPPNLQYEPNPGFFGSDSFTFNVSDGIDSSIPAGVVTINVAKNTRPVADGQLVTIAEDGETDITLTGSDADGDVLGFTVLTSPTNGALTGTAPDLHYVADPDVNGTDSFTFQVSDGKGGLSTATVTITVTPVNDAPEADDQTVNLQRDMSASFTVDATDGDGDTLSFSPTTSPANGVLSGSFPNLTYTPTAGFVGIDTLEYTVDDGTATDSATVTFNVVPPNDPPTAGSAVVNVAEDDDVDITLDATDPEGGVVVIEITDAPDHGALTGTAPNLSYEPDADYAGADSFTFTVTDDLDQVSTGTISINVLARNDAPSATAQSVSTAEDTATPVVLGGTDVDDIVLTYQVTSAPAHGTVAGTGGNVTYTPAPNYHGPDSFTFRVRDPQGFTGTATVSITVTPVNDAPKATTLSKTVVEDGSVAMTLAGTDVDGDALTFSVVAAPTKGVLLGTGPAHTYKTNANANGFDTFTYVANDGQVSSPSATATIAITAVNDAPDGVSQAVTAVEDSPTPITVSGTDVDGDALTYKVEIAPMKGTLAGTAPNLVYTPAQDYNGTDAFTFSVTDTKGAKDYTTVSINVIAAPQIATKLTAVPNVIAKLGLLTLKWSYPNMKATLQRADTSAPLAGRTLDFYLGATKACSGVTNSAGTATCSGSSSTLVNGYTVKFNGDHDYAPSTATGTVNG